MVSFPYYSHTIPISLGILMGIVWEAYHKGVPLLGVPENPIEGICLLRLMIFQQSLAMLVFPEALWIARFRLAPIQLLGRSSQDL